MTEEKYKQLTESEQKEFISKIIHVCMFSDMAFRSCQEVIKFGELIGAFDNVKFSNENIHKPLYD